jgi:hypothetical protein
MLGQKINEFDNSDGTIETFNKIFPHTKLTGDGYVEILGISESENVFTSSPFIRDLDINGTIIKHDFGSQNFLNFTDFQEADNVRFKYYARDLAGNLLAVAYNCDDLAKKLGVDVGVIKRRLVTEVNENSRSQNKFNVTRREL